MLSTHVNEEFMKGRNMITELQGVLHSTFKDIHESHTHLHSHSEQLSTSLTQVDANANLLHGSLTSLHSHLNTTMKNQGTHFSLIERV